MFYSLTTQQGKNYDGTISVIRVYREDESVMSSTNSNPKKTGSVYHSIVEFLSVDWGQFVIDHGRSVLAVVLTITFVLIGYGGYGLYRDSQIKEDQKKVFTFLEDWKGKHKIENLVAGKKESEEADTYQLSEADWSQLSSFFSQLNYPQTAAPILSLILKSSEAVAEDQRKAALDFFQTVAKLCSQKDLCFYYAQLKVAALYEDARDLASAESTLKSLVSSPWKNEEQLYLDLARIAYEAKKSSELKGYADYFMKTFPDSVHTSLVKYFIKTVDRT